MSASKPLIVFGVKFENMLQIIVSHPLYSIIRFLRLSGLIILLHRFKTKIIVVWKILFVRSMSFQTDPANFYFKFDLFY